jgi:hypothetical protein
MGKRILISSLIGVASGAFCWFLLDRTHRGAGDFNWAIWAAQDLMGHRNPYDRPMQLYPLTSSIFGFPFAWLRLAVGGGCFFGVSSALLAFALSGQGYHRLLVFFAYPYWAALFDAQWTPIILAGAFLWPLLPSALAKPQLGLPVLLTAPSRRGLICSALTLALTFFLMPGWVGQWLSHLHSYSRFYPLLVLPGPLLALALFRYRQRDARLLLLAAMMPQRWFYDGFLLWFIPKSRREIIWTAFFSWGAGIWRWYHLPVSFTQVGRVAILCFYIPMLAVVLTRPATAATQPAQLSE